MDEIIRWNDSPPENWMLRLLTAYRHGWVIRGIYNKRILMGRPRGRSRKRFFTFFLEVQ